MDVKSFKRHNPCNETAYNIRLQIIINTKACLLQNWTEAGYELQGPSVFHPLTLYVIRMVNIIG